MPPKLKPETLWSQCEKCSSYLLTKDLVEHSSECSVDLELKSHNFIKDNTLYGTLDCKNNDEIKNISTCDRDFMVFISQSVLQLLKIPLSEWVVLHDLKKNNYPVARIVWPTNEKSCTSILLTKNCN